MNCPKVDRKIQTFYIICVIAIVYAIAAVAICSFSTVYIRSMPQDLFFQLDGIYRLSIGDKIYHDFSSPLGLLLYIIPYYITKFGVDLAMSVNFASGVLISAAFPFVAYVVWTRFSPFFGLAFGIWVGLALAARMNFGDDMTAVTMAMNYNRQCYAALALALVIFRAPRIKGLTIALIDGFLYAVLTGFLIYTKITFGLVALTFVPIVFWPQRNKLGMFVAFITGLVLFVLAVEYGYGTKFQWVHALQMAAASSGPISAKLFGQIRALEINLPELLICSLVPAWFLHKEHRLTPVTIVFFIMVAGASVGLITENGQRYLLFIPTVLFFIAAPPLATPLNQKVDASAKVGFMITTIVVLVFISGPQLVNIFDATFRTLTLPPMAADNKVLKRIVIRPEGFEKLTGPKTEAVVDDKSTLDAFSVGRYFKPIHPFDTLTMLEYRDYLTDGMRAASEGCDQGARILTLDIGNPFPLLLGWPAGGSMLIIHPDRLLSKAAHPSAEEMFRNVNCVLVPKLPVKLEARDVMLDVYGSFLSGRFTAVHETPLWQILKLSSPPDSR